MLSNQWPYTDSVFSVIYPKSAGCTQNPHFNHAFASGLKKKKSQPSPTNKITAIEHNTCYFLAVPTICE